MNRQSIALGLIGLLVFMAAFSLSASHPQPDLKKLSSNHQFFLLRDALDKQNQPPNFFAGEAACAFNNTAACRRNFAKVLAGAPSANVSITIHHILAYAALREGRYRRALREMDAVLVLDPNNPDARETRPFMEALSHFPNQKVRRHGAGKATVRMEQWRLPLVINGKKASFLFDTGANLSTLSESEARRLGMKVHAVGSAADAVDVNGNRVTTRVALARSLRLGGIELRNVAFLVTADHQQPFVHMKPGQRGLIGLPVLLAMGSIAWTRDGVFTARVSRGRTNLSAANICFDDMSLVAQARFEKRPLPFLLDTGARTSVLWPKFADVAAELIRKSGTRKSYRISGMGGSREFRVTTVPEVALELGGMPVLLRPAHVLDSEQRTESKWFYGNLGIDLLRQAQKVSINFKTMTLRLEGAAGDSEQRR